MIISWNTTLGRTLVAYWHIPARQYIKCNKAEQPSKRSIFDRGFRSA